MEPTWLSCRIKKLYLGQVARDGLLCFQWTKRVADLERVQLSLFGGPAAEVVAFFGMALELDQHS